MLFQIWLCMSERSDALKNILAEDCKFMQLTVFRVRVIFITLSNLHSLCILCQYYVKATAIRSIFDKNVHFQPIY